MESAKSLDEYELIARLLHDIQKCHGGVFNSRSRYLTCKKVKKRLYAEGMGFLTKTLPRLGKALDKALSCNTPLDSVSLGFKPLKDSKLPQFLGELFQMVLRHDGTVLQEPCADCVRDLRAVLYLFYKYELPYSDEQEQQVIDKFLETEAHLDSVSDYFRQLGEDYQKHHKGRRKKFNNLSPVDVVREAKILLHSLFAYFDPSNIVPTHGPGAVSTKEQLWDKWTFTTIPRRLTDEYPWDAYFCASAGHVCDSLHDYKSVKDTEVPAKVILVPKDSRGPRLISEEPLYNQWIQQGLSRAIRSLVETHRLTRWNVSFSDQGPNKRGAELGSKYGGYATLDLNEASDRVHLELVRLLFPPHLFRCMEACRSSSTELPNKDIKPLSKFAPMGSALCFPVLALVTWAILRSSAPDADTASRIRVYGDDVIVPTAYAENAIKQLELFHLKVNRDKSCIRGFFRESCGTDAFMGKVVTPVRLRTVWSESPSPSAYCSWIAYANQFYDRRYFAVYDYIVERLCAIYGTIPDERYQSQDRYPRLREVPDSHRTRKWRINTLLQKKEWLVRCLESRSIRHELPGWSMLLRCFTEGWHAQLEGSDRPARWDEVDKFIYTRPFSARRYTKRGQAKLVFRWR